MIVHKIAFAVCDIKIKSIYLRQPGIEPRSTAWEAAMITITPLSLLQSRKETMMTKGHARNVWRGSQNTTRDFCSLFFVEHSLTYLVNCHAAYRNSFFFCYLLERRQPGVVCSGSVCNPALYSTVACLVRRMRLR